MLGRGLESLIPDRNHRRGELNDSVHQPTQNLRRHSLAGEAEIQSSKSHTNARASVESVFQIEVDKIKPNPHQPRRSFNDEQLEELASSIREVGIIQPLIVTKIEKETDTGTSIEYQLIAGERRWRAAKKAGLERVPAIIRRVDQDKEKLETALIENIQRADLNPIEAARSYAKLQEEFGLTQREIAARLGKSRETISNTVRLLNLPTHIQEAIAANKLSDSQGRILLTVNNSAEQQKLFEEIIANNISVRELKEKVAALKRPSSSYSSNSFSSALSGDPETRFLQEQLQEALGTKVSVQKSGKGGKITISFYSPEELKNIIQKIIRDDSQPS